MNVVDVLDKFSLAWSQKKVEEVVNLFAEDGMYAASVGPGPGKNAYGREEIRALIETMFTVDFGAVVETSDPVIFEDGAFWTWKYTMPDGSIELGCDFLRVHKGEITLKDAYRKVKTEAGV